MHEGKRHGKEYVRGGGGFVFVEGGLCALSAFLIGLLGNDSDSRKKYCIAFGVETNVFGTIFVGGWEKIRQQVLRVAIDRHLALYQLPRFLSWRFNYGSVCSPSKGEGYTMCTFPNLSISLPFPFLGFLQLFHLLNVLPVFSPIVQLVYLPTGRSRRYFC